MALGQAKLVQPQGLTTVERDLMAVVGIDVGRLIYNETLNVLQMWNGVAWDNVISSPTIPSTMVVGSIPMTQITGNFDGNRLIGNIDGGLY